MTIWSEPAFPRDGSAYVHDGDRSGVRSQDGMSIRAYFAAHAPAEPQAWFEPVMPSGPEQPPDKPSFPANFPKDLEERNFIINLAWSWRRDPVYDLATYADPRANDWMRNRGNDLIARARPFLAKYEQQWKAYWDAKLAYDRECARQRSIQWPWAWSDAVLAAASTGEHA